MINLSKSFKLLTATTNSVIYYSGSTLIVLSGVNNNDYFFSTDNTLTNQVINNDINKYNYCLNTGWRERKFLIQYFLEKNKSNWFITNSDNTFDHFDGCYKDNSTINIIEVKFRNCKSTDYPTDYIFKKKYFDLFDLKNFNKTKDNQIKIHYILIFNDYVYRSYELSDIDLDFSIEISINDHPGSDKMKSVVNGELDIKLAKTGKIKFK